MHTERSNGGQEKQITLKTSFSALNVSDKNTEKKLPLTGTDSALMLTMVLKTYVPVADLP